MCVFLLIAFSAVFAIGQPWIELSKLAKQCQDADDLQGAESLYREALRSAEKELGESDKRLTPLLSALAFSLHFDARNAEAEPLAQRAYSIARESGDQRLTGLMLNTLGIIISGEGQKARAEPVLRRSAALLEAGSLDFARASNNLAALYLDTHQYAKAEQELARVLPLYEKYLGSDHPEMALVFGNMFAVLAGQNRSGEGEPYLRRALAIAEKQFPDGLKMANLQLCLAKLEADRENLKAAVRLLEKVIAIQERLLGPEHPQLANTLVAYSNVLRRMHQKAEARQALNRANLILKPALSDVK
jgi:tetratricopeptide (TPR) repeat protein